MLRTLEREIEPVNTSFSCRKLTPFGSFLSQTQALHMAASTGCLDALRLALHEGSRPDEQDAVREGPSLPGGAERPIAGVRSSIMSEMDLGLMPTPPIP